MSHFLKNLNQKYYIALGICIALIFFIIDVISNISFIFSLYRIIRFVGPIVALFFLIIALVKIVSKTFTVYVYATIIMFLIGAIIATSISLIFTYDFLKIIEIVVCVIVLGYTLIVKKGEEARLQEEISPQQKIAQREYNIEMIKFAVGGGLIVIGIIVVIFGLYGLVALGVSDINNLGGKILFGILVGIPFIVFIVPGYYIVRSAYRKRYISKH